MVFVLLALGIILAGGFSALAAARRTRLAGPLAAGTVVAGAGLGLYPVVKVLAGGEALALQLPWNLIPGAALALHLDGLSALFLTAILVLSALSAIYGVGYLRQGAEKESGEKAEQPKSRNAENTALPKSPDHPITRSPDQKSSLGHSWFFFNLLVASMIVVVLASNAILFLLAWEVMAVASFFLVVQDDEREEVRQAGWTYLVATHLGTAFLLVLFLLLGGSGSFDFAAFTGAGGQGETFRSLLFVLALIGFGTKAGLIPLHVWLPEAHPAAPSHVSALMSGVMIKTGIYGLLRTITFLGTPPAWWGWVLIATGGVSGVLGVLFALAQHDLKRLLAYHSVENIGIILLGMGLGVLGLSTGQPLLVAFGLAGAMLHVVNHALFKGLLFLGAGAVRHGTHTLNLEELGGLLKRMPWTALTFLIGATAISGLPPLNGFISEFLIYLASFGTGLAEPANLAVAAVGVIVSLALIGGLAAACFAKVVGVAFLGEPRTEAAAQAHEMGWTMRLPMLILAAACFAIGLTGPWLLPYLGPPVAVVSGWPLEKVQTSLLSAQGNLCGVVFAATCFFVVLGLLVLLRRKLLSRQTVGQTGTWDCGFAAPTARMQYTASSFAQPITNLFQTVLRTHVEEKIPQGEAGLPKTANMAPEFFPAQGSFHSHTPEVFREYAFAPMFRALGWLMGRLRWLQHGRVQVYVLYITVTLLVLLIWKLG